MQSIGHKHRAIKWTYDVAKEQWDRESVRVSMSRAPFEEGGMRLCYRAHEHARNGDIFECVVKVSTILHTELVRFARWTFIKDESQSRSEVITF